MTTSRRTNDPAKRQGAADLDPLRDDELDVLVATLERRLFVAGCDGTLGIAEQWLTASGLDVARVLAWLQRHGGFCDCEVLFNVVPKVATARSMRAN